MSDLPVRDHVEAIAAAVPLAGTRAVDVGCGKGILVRQLAARGARVVGVEIEADKLAVAEAEPRAADERYVEGRGEAIPLPDGSVDLVSFVFSFHHVPVPHLADALAEAARVLVPGGHLAVAEPLAEGPYFEMIRVVEDETEVRRAALEALRNAGAAGFVHCATEHYVQRRRYADPEAVRAQSIAVDPGRKEAFDRHFATVAAAFHANGRLGEDGARVFDQPVRFDLFRKG